MGYNEGCSCHPERGAAVVWAWIAGALCGAVLGWAVTHVRVGRVNPRGVGGAPYQWRSVASERVLTCGPGS